MQDCLAREQSTKKLSEVLLNVTSQIIPPTQVYCPSTDPSKFAVHASPGTIPDELHKVRHPDINLHMFSQLLLKMQLLVHNAVLLLFGKSFVQLRIVRVGSTKSLQPLIKSP